MKKVMVTGAFDVLHKGHEHFFREAKQQGDFLVVVVGRDKTIEKVKDELPLNNENVRLRNVKKLGIADKVVLGHEDDQLKIVEEEKPNIICLGYDQKSFITKGLREKLAKRGLTPEIKIMEPFKPETYKSSIMKKKGLE